MLFLSLLILLNQSTQELSDSLLSIYNLYSSTGAAIETIKPRVETAFLRVFSQSPDWSVDSVLKYVEDTLKKRDSTHLDYIRRYMAKLDTIKTILLKRFWCTKLYIKVLGLKEEPESIEVFFEKNSLVKKKRMLSDPNYACSLYFNYPKSAFKNKEDSSEYVIIKIRSKERELFKDRFRITFYKGDTLVDTIRYFFLIRDEIPNHYQLTVLPYFDRSKSMKKISPRSLYSELFSKRELGFTFIRYGYCFADSCKLLEEAGRELERLSETTSFGPVFNNLRRPLGERPPPEKTILCCVLFTDGRESRGARDCPLREFCPGTDKFRKFRESLWKNSLAYFQEGNFLVLLPVLFDAEGEKGTLNSCKRWSESLFTPLTRYADVVTVQRLLTYGKSAPSYGRFHIPVLPESESSKLTSQLIIQRFLDCLSYLFNIGKFNMEVKEDEIWIRVDSFMIPQDLNAKELKIYSDYERKEYYWLVYKGINKILTEEGKIGTIGNKHLYIIPPKRGQQNILDFEKSKSFFTSRPSFSLKCNNSDFFVRETIFLIKPFEDRDSYLLRWDDNNYLKNYQTLTSQIRIHLNHFLLLALVEKGDTLGLTYVSKSYLWAPWEAQLLILITFICAFTLLSNLLEKERRIRLILTLLLLSIGGVIIFLAFKFPISLKVEVFLILIIPPCGILLLPSASMDQKLCQGLRKILPYLPYIVITGISLFLPLNEFWGLIFLGFVTGGLLLAGLSSLSGVPRILSFVPVFLLVVVLGAWLICVFFSLTFPPNWIYSLFPLFSSFLCGFLLPAWASLLSSRGSPHKPIGGNS
ncbi:MAG: hypothetical protein ABIK84_00395 [candidate division WOR-3 bacterium]